MLLGEQLLLVLGQQLRLHLAQQLGLGGEVQVTLYPCLLQLEALLSFLQRAVRSSGVQWEGKGVRGWMVVTGWGPGKRVGGLLSSAGISGRHAPPTTTAIPCATVSSALCLRGPGAAGPAVHYPSRSRRADLGSMGAGVA